jgi:hypothetical protein
VNVFNILPSHIHRDVTKLDLRLHTCNLSLEVARFDKPRAFDLPKWLGCRRRV